VLQHEDGHWPKAGTGTTPAPTSFWKGIETMTDIAEATKLAMQVGKLGGQIEAFQETVQKLADELVQERARSAGVMAVLKKAWKKHDVKGPAEFGPNQATVYTLLEMFEKADSDSRALEVTLAEVLKLLMEYEDDAEEDRGAVAMSRHLCRKALKGKTL